MKLTRTMAIQWIWGLVMFMLVTAAPVGAQTADIKANGLDDSVALRSDQSLSITVSLKPGSLEDNPADWWIAVHIPPDVWIHLDITKGYVEWKPGLAVTYQGPLAALAPLEILSVSDLPVGTYYFCFGVDVPMNGNLSAMDTLYWDVVAVTVSEFAGSYPVVDTGQTACYDDSALISCPGPGEDFYGQDAQYHGNPPSYSLSGDGLTVYDAVTGLTWTRSPDLDQDGDIDVDDKLTFAEAQSYPAILNDLNYGGYSDWRLPGMKTLYSLMDFRGTDPSGQEAEAATPFIDTAFFDFAYGDTAAGERAIDAQFWSADAYGAHVFGDRSAAFGLNLADGRIKAYPTDGTPSKKNYVYFVRGNPAYGVNDYTDNADGTISDRATGLMWSRDDSGTGMTWREALAWVHQKNNEHYLGYDDWRLPNAKEMQSIVDYSRAPAVTGSAAVSPVFAVTEIADEAGESDYPWFWTGTTHVRSNGNGDAGVYICFGRAMGYLNGSWLDVHGAGAQRSDRKYDDFSGYTYTPYGYYFEKSPQGDAVRIFNYIRLVRSGVP